MTTNSPEFPLPRLTPVHRSKHPPTDEQIEALEQKGWFREHYAFLRKIYKDWNEDVWNHKWTFVTTECHLCHITGLTISDGRTPLCVLCLSEYPQVSWHPTGSVRANTKMLMTHAATCPDHFQIQSSGTSSAPSTEHP